MDMTMFTISGNSIEGGLPSNLASQTRMINLSFGWNDLSGEWPSDLTSMGQLRFIRANDNNFTGTVPRVDTTNDALNFLYFQNNRMSGEVPASLAGIADLPRIGAGDLDIRNNDFTGADKQPLIDALSADGNLDVLRH